MACPPCLRRSALIAALAPAISRLQPLTRQRLLGLLALPEGQLLRAANVEDPGKFSRRLQIGQDETGNQSQAHRTETGRATERVPVPTALCRHDPTYPQALAQLDSAPAVLYATCTIKRLQRLLAAPTVALAGNLVRTTYAQQVAFALAHDLAAAGLTIISGLNDGLEGTAHHGVLHSHGRSVAALPCAPDMPSSHRENHLHRCILDRGAAISEFPPGFHQPPRWCYIATRRIIAGLADVLVVVEATERSSALFTAQIAADLGRDVAVVPGRITDPVGQGTLTLLRDGAQPVGEAQDVLDLIYGARVAV